jgi:hypothetical protein
MKAQMLRDALVQWLQEDRILTGELIPTKEGRRAWVGIYPLSLKRQGTHARLKREGLAILPGADVHVYLISTFEIDVSLLDKYFSEEEIENKRDFILFGEDALFEKLEELHIPLEILDSPARNDYPL